MNYLIIGSEGFIGRALVAYFGPQEKNLVYTSDRQENTSNWSHEHLVLDFSTGVKNLPFRGVDVIINASGSANVQASFMNEEADKVANLTNVEIILNEIVVQASEAKFINISSAAVYGVPSQLPIHEKFAEGAIPISPYGKHKKMSEELLLEFARIKGLRTHSLRVFSCFGPNQRKLLFWDVFQKAKSSLNKELVLFGTGHESRDYIFIDDLCMAVEKVVINGEFDGSSINVASGREVEISFAAQKALDILDPLIKLSFNGEVRIGDPNNWVADVSKLSSLGFIPRFTFEKGLEEYYKWVLSIDE
jgi:UDP-glucose 4-epimerase